MRSPVSSRRGPSTRTRLRLPVSFTTSGNALTLSVPHVGVGSAYPIEADPSWYGKIDRYDNVASTNWEIRTFNNMAAGLTAGAGAAALASVLGVTAPPAGVIRGVCGMGAGAYWYIANGFS